MTNEEIILLEGLKLCESKEQMALWLNNIQYACDFLNWLARVAKGADNE